MNFGRERPTCKEEGCSMLCVILAKYNGSFVFSSVYSNYCHKHNKCQECGEVNSWDIKLCYDCDHKK